MSQVRDPVCGMMVDTSKAPARMSYQGEVYYFCSDNCRDAFQENPDRYVKSPTTAGSSRTHGVKPKM